MIGSGNPEEGELRPQLLDRFGLSVEVRTPSVLADRIEVVRRRDAYDRDPDQFIGSLGESGRRRARSGAPARRALSALHASDEVLESASRLCMSIGADGLRGELTILRAARALAALRGDRPSPSNICAM